MKQTLSIIALMTIIFSTLIFTGYVLSPKQGSTWRLAPPTCLISEACPR